MTRKQRHVTRIIHSLDEIPDFATEAEEGEFWRTHAFSEELMDQATWELDDPLAPWRAQREEQRPARGR